MTSTSLAAALGSVLLHSLWIGAVIAGWAALSLRILRPARPQLRYWIAMGALGAMVALPLFVMVAGDPAGHTWMQLVAGAWLLGTLVMTIRIVSSWRQVCVLRRAAQPAADHWQQIVDDAAEQIGVRQEVQLLRSDLIDVPCSLGGRLPAVVVPAGMLDRLDGAHSRTILVHELAHVARRDYEWNLLQAILDAALFFHPAAWWLSNTIRHERELSCDEMFGAVGDPMALAQALAALEAHRSGPIPEEGAEVGRPLFDRVRALVSHSRTTDWRRRVWPVAATALAAGGIALALSAISFTDLTSSPTSWPWAAWLAAASLGLLVGLRHACEPDHLVAVATLVARKGDPRSAVRLGASWGFGHMLSLLFIGSGLAMARQAMPEPLVRMFEVAVAVMVIGMGMRALYRGWRLASQTPATSHAHGAINHSHATSGAHVHVGPFTFARPPLVVGLVHGLAGSGALTALAVATLPTVLAQLGFMLVFGLGSTIGMAAVAGLANWHVTRFVRTPAALGALSLATGGLAITVGVLWALPLLRP